MKDDQHYIDKIFSEALTNYQELPDDQAWEGIAVGVATTPKAVTKTALFKKYLGLVLVTSYLLVGPLFYSDLLFDGAGDTKVNNMNTLETSKMESIDREIADVTSDPEVGAENRQSLTDSDRALANQLSDPLKSALEKQEQPIENAANASIDKELWAVDLSKQEQKQEMLAGQSSQVPRQSFEVENVVESLSLPDFAYGTFLFPVLEEAAPIDSISEFDYYEKAWKWFVSPYVMPVYWSGSGLGRAQVGVDVGRYFNGRSSVQIGLRYQLSSGDPYRGDQGVLTIPMQYRKYFGRSQFKWFLGAGAVVIPWASPGRPFDNAFYSGSLLDMEFSGGMIYHPSDKMRFFVSPSWQQPFSGDHGVSVQLGIQFRF